MLESDLATLADQLRSLDPSGEGDFRVCFGIFSRHLPVAHFDSQSQAPQGGADVWSGTHDAVQIGPEAKRYGSSTTLPLDQLKAKLLDAVRQADPPDLWVLAATRSISDTDQRNSRGSERRRGYRCSSWTGQEKHKHCLVWRSCAPLSLRQWPEDLTTMVIWKQRSAGSEKTPDSRRVHYSILKLLVASAIGKRCRRNDPTSESKGRSSNHILTF